MEDTEKIQAELLPYLKLQESEEILVINRSDEKKILPIRELAKYHDPDALPEHFFPTKGKNYEYNEIEIFTSQRVIFLCLNLDYMEEDEVTPISDIFHIDNYLVWVNNEDIKECDIEFGGFWKGITVKFNFFYDDGETATILPMRVICSDYSRYLKLRDVLVHRIGLNSAKIKYQEQKRMKSICSFNRSFNIYGFILLVILGLYILEKMISEEFSFSLNYADLVLFLLYLAFFITYNLYWIRALKKDTETFFVYTDKDFTWYKGPWVNFIVFVLCALVVIIDIAYSTIISNYILSFFASIGSVACFLGLSILIGAIIDKKKKKKKKK
ncbi:MAG: hypothetical protein ACTSQH_06505 [Candidatus Hodarchaeales archaeon]